jgi:hypothetical protein
MNIFKSFIQAALVCAALVIVSQPCSAQTSSTPNLAGNWQGILSAGQKLRIELKVTESSPGQFAGTLDLPEAGVTNLPLEHFSYADRILSFEFNIGAPSRFEGVVSRDGTEVVGSFYQGGNIIPLNLTHTDPKPDLNVIPFATDLVIIPFISLKSFLDHGRVFAEEKMRALIIALVLVLTGCAAHGHECRRRRDGRGKSCRRNQRSNNCASSTGSAPAAACRSRIAFPAP